jgi:hypothetical protein
MGRAMKSCVNGVAMTVLLPFILGGCGLNVPEKSLFRDDTSDPAKHYFSTQGEYEKKLVDHVVYELANAVYEGVQHSRLPWLADWGSSATLTISAENQSSLNPSTLLTQPFENVLHHFPSGLVTSNQSFSLAAGLNASANTTRVETIQFTMLNSVLIDWAKRNAQTAQSCTDLETGPMIDGDLKIRQFINDKAMIARLGTPASYTPWQWPIYNTFTESLTFVAIFGGNITPTWKLWNITTANTNPLLMAQATYTNTLIVTEGPIGTYPKQGVAAALNSNAQQQHNTQVQAGAIATSLQGQTQPLLVFTHPV